MQALAAICLLLAGAFSDWRIHSDGPFLESSRDRLRRVVPEVIIGKISALARCTDTIGRIHARIPEQPQITLTPGTKEVVAASSHCEDRNISVE